MRFLFFLCIGSQAFAQTADEVINKSITASGGADKWSKVVAMKYEGNYVMGPGMLAPVTEIQFTKPAMAYYSDFTWQGMTSKTVMQADSGWTYNPFGGKRETDPINAEEIRSLKLDADPQGLLFNYAKKGYTADYLGLDDMEGSEVHKVRLTTKEGDMVYFYIDVQSFYVLKMVKRMKFKTKEDKSFVVYSDFRKNDFGLTMPYSTQRVDEKGNEQGGPVMLTKITVNPVFDSKLLDKPLSK